MCEVPIAYHMIDVHTVLNEVVQSLNIYYSYNRTCYFIFSYSKIYL